MSNLFDRVGIDLGVIVLLLIVLVIVLAIMTVSMSLRLTRLNQKYKSFMKGREGQSLEKLFSAVEDFERVAYPLSKKCCRSAKRKNG